MLALSPKIGEQAMLPERYNASQHYLHDLHDGGRNSSKAIWVLIADHDEALLACYQDSLEAEGFSVQTATEAVEFLTKLRRCLPDMIVLEPYLSRGTNRQLACALRRRNHLPPVPVLIHSSEGNAPANLVFPICGYEVQPLPPERLAKRIREVLAL